MSWIDSHVHLTHFDSVDEIDKVLTESIKKGGTYFFQGGIDPADWQKQSEIQIRFPSQVGTSFGLHPWYVDTESKEILNKAYERLQVLAPDSLAVGECGLDYSQRTDPDHYPKQQKYFEMQLSLAQALSKPLVLHVVRAHTEALRTLKSHSSKPLTGLVHSFSGNLETANQYIELGLLISVGPGLLAREGFFALKKMIGKIDLKHVVLETDAPDQLKSPGLIPAVAQAISEHRKESAEEILSITSQNFRRVFKC